MPSYLNLRSTSWFQIFEVRLFRNCDIFSYLFRLKINLKAQHSQTKLFYNGKLISFTLAFIQNFIKFLSRIFSKEITLTHVNAFQLSISFNKLIILMYEWYSCSISIDFKNIHKFVRVNCLIFLLILFFLFYECLNPISKIIMFNMENTTIIMIFLLNFHL